MIFPLAQMQRDTEIIAFLITHWTCCGIGSDEPSWSHGAATRTSQRTEFLQLAPTPVPLELPTDTGEPVSAAGITASPTVVPHNKERVTRILCVCGLFCLTSPPRNREAVASLESRCLFYRLHPQQKACQAAQIRPR